MAQYLEELRRQKRTVLTDVNELMVLTKVLEETGVNYKWAIVERGKYSVTI
jgi:hypothetical protein